MRVVIADDEALFRGGLRALLEGAGVTVVADVVNAAELLAAVATEEPDAVITDIRMPPDGTDDGIRAAVAIRSSHPAVAVMVLSHHVQRRYATDLAVHGAGQIGYLLKQRVADISQFVHKLQIIVDGGTVLDREVIDVLMQQARWGDQGPAKMTERQQEVLALIAEGWSNTAIAERLALTERGVVHHMSNIYRLLNLPDDLDHHRRVLAALRYLDLASNR